MNGCAYCGQAVRGEGTTIDDHVYCKFDCARMGVFHEAAIQEEVVCGITDLSGVDWL